MKKHKNLISTVTEHQPSGPSGRIYLNNNDGIISCSRPLSLYVYTIFTFFQLYFTYTYTPINYVTMMYCGTTCLKLAHSLATIVANEKESGAEILRGLTLLFIRIIEFIVIIQIFTIYANNLHIVSIYVVCSSIIDLALTLLCISNWCGCIRQKNVDNGYDLFSFC